ncbi:hypothetical protein [Neobacillus sp. D3-1R]|uniref:hypothetical protein n=1 Tax=Neobacillus sp. D3-1R TaxID=3445778 RepID=UPI003FA01CAB
MELGKKVIYQGEEYIIFYTYENGYCEIKEINDSNIINVLLVPESKIQPAC